MWHQPCQRCKYTTSVDIQNRAIKSYKVTHSESHESAVSLLDSREQRHIRAFIKVILSTSLGQWKTKTLDQTFIIFHQRKAESACVCVMNGNVWKGLWCQKLGGINRQKSGEDSSVRWTTTTKIRILLCLSVCIVTAFSGLWLDYGWHVHTIGFQTSYSLFSCIHVLRYLRVQPQIDCMARKVTITMTI